MFARPDVKFKLSAAAHKNQCPAHLKKWGSIPEPPHNNIFFLQPPSVRSVMYQVTQSGKFGGCRFVWYFVTR